MIRIIENFPRFNNISLGRNLLVLAFFDDSNFETFSYQNYAQFIATQHYTQSGLIRNGPIRITSEILGFFKKSLCSETLKIKKQ